MYVYCFLFFVKQNTAYEMRISDWSSDVCSSDLLTRRPENNVAPYAYMGVSILHPRALAEAPDGAFSLNLVYDRAEEAGRLYGAVHDGLWYHISTPADLDEANRRFAQGQIGRAHV